MGCSKFRIPKIGREAPAPLKGRVFKIGILCRWRLLYGKALSAALRGLKAQQVRSPGQRPGYHALFPTPCKGKSKNQPFAHTFALTGRRRLYIDTQGVALGYGLTALSGRSFSRFVRLSCAHALSLAVWSKNAQRFF